MAVLGIIWGHFSYFFSRGQHHFSTDYHLQVAYVGWVECDHLPRWDSCPGSPFCIHVWTGEVKWGSETWDGLRKFWILLEFLCSLSISWNSLVWTENYASSPLFISDFNYDLVHVCWGRCETGPDLNKTVVCVEERKPEETRWNLIKLKSYWQLLVESKQIQVCMHTSSFGCWKWNDGRRRDGVSIVKVLWLYMPRSCLTPGSFTLFYESGSTV